MKKTCSDQAELLKSAMTKQENITLSFGRYVFILAAAILFITAVGMGLYTLLAPLNSKQEKLVPADYSSHFDVPKYNPVEMLKREEDLKKAKESFKSNLNDVVEQVRANSKNLREVINEIEERYEALGETPDYIGNMRKLDELSNSMSKEIREACEVTNKANNQQKESLERDLAKISERFEFPKGEISTNHVTRVDANIKEDANCLEYSAKIKKIAENLSGAYSGRWGLPYYGKHVFNQKISQRLELPENSELLGGNYILKGKFSEAPRVREVVYVDDLANKPLNEIKNQDKHDISMVIYKPSTTGYLSSNEEGVRVIGNPWSSNDNESVVFEVKFPGLESWSLYRLSQSDYSAAPIESNAQFHLIYDDNDLFMNSQGEVVVSEIVDSKDKAAYEFSIEAVNDDDEVEYIKDVVVIVDPYSYRKGSNEKVRLPIAVNNLIENVIPHLEESKVSNDHDPKQVELYIDSLESFSQGLKNYYSNLENDLEGKNLLTITNAKVLATEITSQIKEHALAAIHENKRFKFDEGAIDNKTYTDRLKEKFHDMKLKIGFNITALFYVIFILIFFAAERHFRFIKARNENK